jgi:GNAT superfamily N-acetyltransferase
MSTSIHVRPIGTAAERKRFIQFQWRVYQGNPYWVPPLLSEREMFLDPQRNPFYQHADVQLFVAERDGEIVGTIAALVNHRHNEFHQERTGFFGFFEVLNDYSIAEALFATARDWVKERGMDTLRGPASFSTNEEVGLLLNHYDRRPGILTTYNPPYYVDFVERFGFRKAMDLLLYYMDVTMLGPNQEFPEKLLRVVELARKRSDLTIRKANLKRFHEEVERIKKVYNSAWARNWGFVPLTDAEIDYIAEGLRQFVDPDLIVMVEKDGEPVGISLALPDIHQVLWHIRDGRLFPTGWLKFLWYRRQIDTARFWALGVLEPYRARGVDALLYYETAKAALPKGYKHAEMGWVLENNDKMNQVARSLGARLYKTFRLYDLPL